MMGQTPWDLTYKMNAITCRYQPRDARSKKVLSELRQAVKKADRVYIATDPDREGETIGWHLQQALNLRNPQRVVYSEITPQAVRAAIAHPRTLNQDLVAAGRARDCLDKLVGYTGSRHVVWPLKERRKVHGASSERHPAPALCTGARDSGLCTPGLLERLGDLW
jgi:DNA topoisomerase-1